MLQLAPRFGMTPGELARRLTPREMAEYQALLGIEPWGDYRLDALVAHALYHLVGVWSDDPKKLTKAQFFPRWGRRKKKIDRSDPKVAAKARRQIRALVEALRAGQPATPPRS